MFALHFLPILLSQLVSLLDIEALIVVCGLCDGLLEVDVFADALEMGHDLTVVTHCDAVSAGHHQGQREGVHKFCPVFCCQDALPEAQGLKKLKFLTEEKRDPPEGVVEGVDA